MKVAVTTDGAFPAKGGGMARHTTFLARHLARVGVQVHVFHPGPERCFVDSNVSETLVVSKALTFPGHYIVDSWNLAKVMASAVNSSASDWDAVYAQGMSLWGRVEQVDAPIIVNPHGLEFFQSHSLRERVISFPVRRAFTSMLPRADRVVSLGGRLTVMLTTKARVPQDKIVLIPNGVDLGYIDNLLDSRQSSRKDVVRFVFVGRLAFNKGLPELIEAFKSMDAPASELKIIGDGKLRAQLKASIATARIEMLGSVDDETLFSTLESADCLVLPTRGEGMPTAILEAMACRLPVIATPVGAIPDLVDAENGILVSPGDAGELRKALEMVARMDDEERRSMGERARARIESRFAWPAVADRTLEVLRDAARSRTCAGA